MPEKRRKTDARADPDKKHGRPRILPDDLDTRHQIRCNSSKLEAWTERARDQGFRDVSTWLRKLADDDMKRAAR